MEDTNFEVQDQEVESVNTPETVAEGGELAAAAPETFGTKCKAFFKKCGAFLKYYLKQRKTWVDISVWLALAIGAFIILIPFIWLVLSTFKDSTEIYMSNIFPKKWTGAAYTGMWERTSRMAAGGLLRGFLNSFLTTVPVVLVQVVVSAMAAYAFAKLDFKGKNALFIVMLSTMMVPFAAVMVPQAWLYGQLGLTEGPLAVMIPKLFGSITTVFFLRQFLYGIPKSISEAALLDGAGYTRIFMSIILPLIMPALATQFILSF
ncbi:MAG: carbohydrate ABC transporter permease, partial [Clostridia bacterium]|nr:carbohydrate ABC transporter permease [Clostridia bacterium]